LAQGAKRAAVNIANIHKVRDNAMGQNSRQPEKGCSYNGRSLCRAACPYSRYELRHPSRDQSVLAATHTWFIMLGTLGPVHNQLILVPSGFFEEAKIDAKDAAQ
jgi:hypothetical protein